MGGQLRILFAIFSICFLINGAVCQNETGYEEKEYTPYNGWYNNRVHPEWGVVESPLFRILESHYEDGTSAPSGYLRPNPREVSNATMSGLTGEGSYVNRTALLVFFGQQVVEEVLDAQRPECPPDYFNIDIPKGDLLYDKEGKGDIFIPFLRSRYNQSVSGYNSTNPRQQLNENTAFIDGGLTYGVSKAWADGLRLLKSTCPERTETNSILGGDGGPCGNVTDCRGEMASYKGEGRFPIENSLGLPLANPPPPRDHPQLKSVKRLFRLGNPRGNENPFLLTFGVLWFRHHNWLARRIRTEHPTWSDERVFNEARIWNIAVHQRIILYEWLPQLLGPCDFLRSMNCSCNDVPSYTGYKPTVFPGITHVFQSAAMRWGHTLVPPGVYRRTGYNQGGPGSCQFVNTTYKTSGGRHDLEERPALRTCNTYWNSNEAVQESDIDQLLMGMASQICEREDNIITPDLRGSVFGPLEFSRRDLMALNIQAFIVTTGGFELIPAPIKLLEFSCIQYKPYEMPQRGRDHGLPDYQTARKSLGLKTLESFEEINPFLFSYQRHTSSPPDLENETGADVLRRLKEVHDNDMSLIDIWTGGLLETLPSGPGELFRTIILDQFVRIRDGDRFWYENIENGVFTLDQIMEINATTIRDVILRTNPSMHEDDIQNNPFRWNPAKDNRTYCEQPGQLSETELANCTPPESYDSSTGSEVSGQLSETELTKCTSETSDSGSEVSFAVSFAVIGIFALFSCLGTSFIA